MIKKEWNKVLDRYLGERAIASEEYYSLNPVQMAIIQEIKKSFKRIIIKNNDKNIEFNEEY